MIQIGFNKIMVNFQANRCSFTTLFKEKSHI